MSADLYAGVMTGNSMDAADAALLRFDGGGAPRLLAQASASMPPELALGLRQFADGAALRAPEILALQNELTDLCARAVAGLRAAPNEVTALGCHGQTVAHLPEAGASWQLLDGARLAEKTGMEVVCDFRSRDIASGGCGAPLAPFFHQTLFAPYAPCDIINIGGIANLTRLNAAGEIEAAFDVGPGMLLIDAWCRKNGRGDYDHNGAFAAEGQVQDDLLAALLRHDYFSRPAPKSCGREEFSLALLPPDLPAPADVQATLVELTARAIAAQARQPAVFLCGGGARHALLRERLTAHLPAAPKPSDAIGMPQMAMESAAFAFLAKCHCDNTPLAAAAITGGKTRLAGARYPN